jgi:biotin carboxyl carrier protein
MVRSAQAAHLCFPIDGILGELDAQLGDFLLTGFDFTTFYACLSKIAPTPADGSLLYYNSANIYSDPSVSAGRLAALRAEPIKAALDSAVLGRQSAFYKKYIDISGIASTIQNFSNIPTAGFLGGNIRYNLEQLLLSYANQNSMIGAAYSADCRTGVVKSTTSVTQVSINTTTTQNAVANSSGVASKGGPVATQSVVTPIGYWQPPAEPDFPPSYTPYPASPGKDPSTPYQAVSTTWTYPAPTTSNTITNNGTPTKPDPSSNQYNATNTGYAYRVPSIENTVQFLRTMNSLGDESYRRYLFGVQVQNVTAILSNELAAIALAVKRLQVAYLNTMLMSPIPGLVTGIFKNVGERVRAGEPVLRIENPNTVWLVGTLVYDGPIPIAAAVPVLAPSPVGSNVSVSTSLYGTPTTISGVVVAVRGHKGEDNQWDVVVSCNNVVSGGTYPSSLIFPLNYYFDFDDTTVTIS